ncbi:hypothetical protein D9M71_405580 [compost metagenome]
MLSEAANAGAWGAALISRTWLTRNKAAWVTPQMPNATTRPISESMLGTSASRPTTIKLQNTREAIKGWRSTMRPPKLLPIRPTAPKPIRYQPTTVPSKPASRSSMSAR